MAHKKGVGSSRNGRDSHFRAGEYSTRFMEQFFERRKAQGGLAASGSAS